MPTVVIQSPKDEERTKLLERPRQFKSRIENKYNIDRLTVFGSVARGSYERDSDVDLIIVGDEFKGKSVLKRAVPFYLEWDPLCPVDILCYTPEEFESKKRQVSIVQEALKEGIEV